MVKPYNIYQQKKLYLEKNIQLLLNLNNDKKNNI